MEEPEPVAETEKWSSYVEHYANSGVDGVAGNNSSAVAAEGIEHPDHRMEISADEADELEPFLGGKWRRKPVFLLRNVRLWRKYSCQIRQPSGKQGTEKTGRGKQQESGAEVTETMSQSDTVETDSSPGKQHDCKAKSS